MQHLKNCLQLSALPLASCLREICLPTPTCKSSGIKEGIPVQACGKMSVQIVACRIPRNTCLNPDPSFTTDKRKHTLVGNYICLDFKHGFPMNVFQRKTNNLSKSMRSKEVAKHPLTVLLVFRDIVFKGTKTGAESSCHNLNRSACQPFTLSSVSGCLLRCSCSIFLVCK